MAIFAKLDGIEGEAVDKDHASWIEVDNASWDHHRIIDSSARASQRTRGETMVGDIQVACAMHKGSMTVQQYCAAGQVIPNVEIHFCRAGNDPSRGLETYLTIKLTNTLITSYATSIAGQAIPIESLTLNATKIEMEYKTADQKGKQQTASAFTWNRETNHAA